MDRGSVNVSAIIVTRGDHSTEPCLEPLREAGIDDLIVWDNSQRENLAVYGRYAAIEEAAGAAIIVQDDDVILDVESVRSLIDAYVPGHVVCNMPRKFRTQRVYQDSALVGFGAIFDRDLPERAFTRFALSSHRNGCIAWGAEGVDRTLFDRECDTVFTMLTPRRFVDLSYVNREFASAPNRLWKRPEHRDERELMRNLARQVRDAA